MGRKEEYRHRKDFHTSHRNPTRPDDIKVFTANPRTALSLIVLQQRLNTLKMLMHPYLTAIYKGARNIRRC